MTKRKIIVGITGGFCTGKTTVSKIFSKLGAEVFSADILAHRSLKEPTIRRKIVNLLGRGILTSGKIDRKKVREIVFDNKVLLKRLSEIIHPYVKKKLKVLIRKSKSRVVILDIPLLIESGLRRLVDVLVVVAACQDRQIRRARQRRINKRQAIKIINSQVPLRKKIALADFVINNDGSINDTKRQIRAVFKEIIKEG